MSLPWIKVFPRVRRHLKTDRLGALLGRKTGVHHLVIDLWLWAADECPSGDLADVPAAIIAQKAGWRGSPERFVSALREVGFIDEDGALHDWDEHQPAHVAAAEAEAGAVDGESKAERRRRLDRERKARKAEAESVRNGAEPKRNEAELPHGDAEAMRKRSGTTAEIDAEKPVFDGLPARAEIEIQIEDPSDSYESGDAAVTGPVPAPTPVDPPAAELRLVPPAGPDPAKVARNAREQAWREAGERIRGHFRAIRGDPKADYTNAGRANVKRSLKAGRTEAEIMKAIDGLWRDERWGRMQPLDYAVSEAGIQRGLAQARAGPPSKPMHTDGAVNQHWAAELAAAEAANGPG